ncbi:MAG: TIR domain-containing protein [Chloroflexota bacterium]
MTNATTEDTIQGYCMRCKMTIDMLDPEPVWTRHGQPGTRGTCPECGGSVFRMGASHLHEGLTPPQPIAIGKRGPKAKLPPNSVYIAYAPQDEDTAQQLSDDLSKMGMATWLHDHTPEEVNWAGGVHPALKECSRMVLVLTDDALSAGDVSAAWGHFREKRKPVVVAQLAGVEPPDDLRRSPRFDFREDYRSSFRRLVQALNR